MHAAPESAFRGDEEVLVEGVGIVISTHWPPPVMIESAADLALVTHIIVLKLSHVFFGRGFLRE